MLKKSKSFNEEYFEEIIEERGGLYRKDTIEI